MGRTTGLQTTDTEIVEAPAYCLFFVFYPLTYGSRLIRFKTFEVHQTTIYTKPSTVVQL